jgi:hypothetical protein
MLNKIVSSFSALLFLATVAMGTDYVRLKHQLETTKTTADIQAVLRNVEAPADPQFSAALRYAVQNPTPFTIAELRKAVDERAQLQTLQASAPTPQVVSGQAKNIKSNPFFRDSGVHDESNWLTLALQRLFERLRNTRSEPSVRPVKAPNVGGGRLLVYVVVGLLAGMVATFLFYVAKHINWKRSLSRKAHAMLSDEEPERSVDEWLSLADALTREGRFREAVRCLYLACLLRFDESNVARFERSQTNWEHLARIQASARRPADVDFLPPTQAFDQIWYGMRVRGVEDVDQFRIWYGQITQSLGTVRA